MSRDSAGGFVVAWASRYQGGDDYGVFGQRFDSGGNPLGGEFLVNTFTADRQRRPAVSHGSAGGFVVVWESRNQDGDGEGIFGQRFDSGASPVGSEFQVNSFTAYGQRFAAISHNSAGDFVVVWDSLQDGSGDGVFGQRFASDGSLLGAEFQVNSFTANYQGLAAISHDSAGGFVVVWASYTQDGPDVGIFAQRFASDGNRLGGEFQVNSFTTNDQEYPAVSHDLGGGFVVVWQSWGQDGSYYGVFGRRFTSGGSPLGGDFQVNSFTIHNQRNPAVSHDSAGRFVVVWDSFNQDGSGDGVFGQRFVVGRIATGPSEGGASKVRRLEGPLLMAPP